MRRHLGPVFEPPVWSRPWDISFTHAELSLSEKLEEPGLVGTEHQAPPPSPPRTDWTFLLEGRTAGWGAQMARAGGLCPTSWVCSHNCDSPVWSHLTSPLPKQGLKERMLQGCSVIMSCCLLRPLRNIFLVKLCLILSCSPETFLPTVAYSEDTWRRMVCFLWAHKKKWGGPLHLQQYNVGRFAVLVEKWELDLGCLSQAPEKAPERLCHKISQGNNDLCELALGRAQPSPVGWRVTVCHVREGQPAAANSIQQDQHLHLVCNPFGTFSPLERRVVGWLNSSKNTVLILLRMFKSAKPKLYIYIF